MVKKRRNKFKMTVKKEEILNCRGNWSKEERKNEEKMILVKVWIKWKNKEKKKGGNEEGKMKK